MSVWRRRRPGRWQVVGATALVAASACFIALVAAACTGEPTTGSKRSVSYFVGRPIPGAGNAAWGGFQWSPDGSELYFEFDSVDWSRAPLMAFRLADSTTRVIDGRPLARLGLVVSRDGSAILQYVADPVPSASDAVRLERIPLSGAQADTLARGVVAFTEGDTLSAVTVRAAGCAAPWNGGCDTLGVRSAHGGWTTVGFGEARSVSPDGTRILFAADPCVRYGPVAICRLMIVDLRTGATRATRFTESTDDNPAANQYRWDERGLRQLKDSADVWWVTDEATGTVSALSIAGGGGGSWSPDDRRVAFWRFDKDLATFSLTVAEIPGGTTHVLAVVPWGQETARMALSPDRTRIAYSVDWAVYVDTLP